MRTLLLPFVFAAFTTAPQAQVLPSGGELQADQACYDVRHYDLSLTVDPEKRRIDGELVMTADITTPTSAVRLDLDGHLEVRSVTANGDAVEFAHARGRIRIPLTRQAERGSTLKVAVEYGGKPRVAPRPPWDGGFTWSKTPEGKQHWIATSCQMQGADLWWPCKDHPSDKPDAMDLRITVPANLYVAANGRLLSDQRSNTGRTFHWRVSTPISNYCVALNIAPYRVLERTYRSTSGEEVETFFFALPESEAKAKQAFPHFLDHLRHMEEVCGPYPFRADKYAVVETPHLGMEHQTIIAYGNGYRLGRDGYDWLHHHEMAHEWWANLVTCRDWKDMWIHEGIGTYMQALYQERLRGRQGYLAEMYKNVGGIGNRKAVAPREVQDSAQIYNGHDIYGKGSWVMHSLRWLMGDDKFFVALRRMAYPDPELEKVRDGSAVRLTDTEEIRQIAERIHGDDLQWFFDVYLHQPAVPELTSRRNGTKLELEWKVPNDLPFPMPVPVRVDGETVRVAMPGGKGELEVGRQQAEVDPERLVLRKFRRTRRSASRRDPPPAATVLFDGSDTSHWRRENDGAPCHWNVADGALEVVRGGNIVTSEPYTDFLLHLEFKIPVEDDLDQGQRKGNSGVYIQRRYEVQILDSFGREPELNGCGAIYNQRKPDVNVSLAPGEWQSYDIVFRAARFDGEKKVANARITVLHNNVLIHDDVEVTGKTGAGMAEGPDAQPIRLQDHNNAVQFRNIWIVEQQ